MTILDTDVGLWKSRVMTQTDDAGGPMIGVPVPDGEMHAIFGPIPTLVREATGHVDYARIYAGVSTPDQQIYWRGLVFIFEPPTDALTSISLLYTGKPFETWLDVRQRVEQFLIRGPRWPGRLLEIQPEGGKTVMLYQRVEDDLPEVGAVMVLVADQGLATQFEQYVQITKVSDVVRTLTIYGSGSAKDIKRRVVTLELSDALERDFDGGAVTDNDAASTAALLRESTTVDAVAFKGIARLPDGATAGESTVQVDDIFTQVVPPLRSSAPIPTTNPLREVTTLINSGQGAVGFTTAMALGAGAVLYLGTPCQRGGFELRMGSTQMTDDGAGNVLSGSAVVAAIAYATGVVTFAATAPAYVGTKTVTFVPAAAPTAHVYTASFGVDVATQDVNYSLELDPPPALGTTRVEYRAQAKWYTLTDRGDGQIKGAQSAYGSGSYSPSTQVARATLGALPDLDSEVIFSWAVPGEAINRSGQTFRKPGFVFQMTQSGGAPGTFVITWNDGIADRTASDDGHGNLSGDATGTVQYSAMPGPIIRVEPATLPPMGTAFHVACDRGELKSYTLPLANITSMAPVNVSLPDTNLRPGSVQVAFDLLEPVRVVNPGGARTYPVAATDNGSGGFAALPNTTVNYAAGTLAVQPGSVIVSDVIADWNLRVNGQLSVSLAAIVYSGPTFTYTAWRSALIGGSRSGYLNSAIVIHYRVAGSTDTSHSETFSGDALVVDLTPTFQEDVIAGAVRFIAAGRTYLDRAGALYADPDPATGAGTVAGTLDYASGEARLGVWTSGHSNSLTVQSLATQIGRAKVADAVFRAPSAPLRPGSLQILADTVDGGALALFAPESGTIATTDCAGRGDVASGLYHLRFGNWVTPAGHENEWWYDASAIRDSDGKIWKPTLIWADSLRVNGVAFSYLPSSVDRIGINARRLPPDGRVAKIRVGDIGVAHHTTTTSLPVPITPGSAHSLGRTRLSRVVITDATGARVYGGATTFSADLRAGTVTFSQNLNLSAYTQPLTATHTIMDRRTVSDVDLSGRVKLSEPLLHDFPDGAYFSTALELGDLQARVDLNMLFTQATWSTSTPVWSDSRVGSEPAFQFDTLNHSIAVTNEGAIQQRWVCVLISSTTYDCYGEDLGKINGRAISINETFAPINPASVTAETPEGAAYFSLPTGALSSGSVGNALRFNTEASKAPIEVLRTVLPGESDVTTDRYSILCIGDTDE